MSTQKYTKEEVESLLSSQKQRVAKLQKRLEKRLEVCREINGLPYCKNCGLCKEDLEIINEENI